MSTNKNELLDRYELCLNRLFSAVLDASKETPSFLKAIGQGGSGVREIRKQFQVSSDLQQLKVEKEEAWKNFNGLGPNDEETDQRAEDLRKLAKILDAAVEQISTGSPVNVGIGGVFAFERDPSGEKVDEFLEAHFGINFATQRIVIPEKNQARLARYLGHQGAFRLFSRDVFDLAETFCGKGPAYFAQTLRNEQRRNIRDEERIGKRSWVFGNGQ